MTNAGKPVYCMHGDVQGLSSIFATLYAILSKLETMTFVKEKVEEPAVVMQNPYAKNPYSPFAKLDKPKPKPAAVQ